MLPKEYRLKKNKDFQKTYKGRGTRNPFFSLKSRSNKRGTTRIGIVAGKRFSQKSTERNKIKRRTREALRRILPKTKKGVDIIITPFSQSKELSFEGIEKNILSLFKKAGILRD